MRLRAIIYVPVIDRNRWEAACLAYCERHEYEVVSLIVGGPERWPHVMSMIQAGEADVVVVVTEDHLDPDRLPRIESVTEELPRCGVLRPRRTRLIRQDEAASP